MSETETKLDAEGQPAKTSEAQLSTSPVVTEASENQAENAEGETDASKDEANASESETEASAPPKRKRSLKLLLIPAALVLLLAIVGALCMMPLTVEIGEPLEPSLIHKLCTLPDDLSEMSTDALGEYPVEIKLFGFIPFTGQVRVRDTVPPQLSLRELYIMPGITLVPEDFVSAVSDATEVTLSFIGEADTTKDGSIRIRAIDEGGNITEAKASFAVDDSLSEAKFELGTTKDAITSDLMKLHDFKDLDMAALDDSVCGSYPVYAAVDGKNYLFHAVIRDTIAPTATVNSYDLLCGQSLSIEDFVTDIDDESEVTATYIVAPDFEKIGRQTLKIRLTDASGNEQICEPMLQIHDMKGKPMVEVGTPTSKSVEAVYSLLVSDTALPSLPDDFETEHLPVGTYVTALIGEYSSIPFAITVVDTEAPALALRDLTVYVGAMPEPSHFVSECIDNSEVTFRFEETPDVTMEGSRPVMVIARDAGGNENAAYAMLHVIKNRVPPVIYGVRNLTAYEGDTVSYRQGVYANDDKDGTVSVKIDASRVKTAQAGVYYVYYSAVDNDGNTATATARVTIKAIDANAVNEKADQVLGQILRTGMSDRQIVHAIYDWCTANIKYSTSTSHLMGYFNKAAYSGFKLKYGNCYTYYAVTSALLTRAGITNRVINRNDWNNPHYWNLVRVDGYWYHVDTCPQPAPHNMKVCLLTDAELAQFTKPGYYSFDRNLFPATP